MVIKKARFRFRKIKGGKQRLAFKNNKVVEVATFKKGKKKVKKLNKRKTKKSWRKK